MAELDPQAQAAYADKVLEQLSRLAGAMDALRRLEAHKTGLALAAYNLLDCLAGFGAQGCTVSQAAERLAVRPQALNTPAAELEDGALIRRERDQADSRAKRLSITAKGQKLLAGAQKVRDGFRQELLRQIPAVNLASLFLGRLEAAAGVVLKRETAPDQA